MVSERCWPAEPQNTGFCREDTLEPLLYKAFRNFYFLKKLSILEYVLSKETHCL